MSLFGITRGVFYSIFWYTQAGHFLGWCRLCRWRPGICAWESTISTSQDNIEEQLVCLCEVINLLRLRWCWFCRWWDGFCTWETTKITCMLRKVVNSWRLKFCTASTSTQLLSTPSKRISNGIPGMQHNNAGGGRGDRRITGANILHTRVNFYEMSVRWGWS